MRAAHRFNGLLELLESRVLFAAGDLDMTFAGGMRNLDISGDNDSGFALTVQNDGKALVAGRTQSGGETGNDFFVARFNVDGTLDSAFGINGVVTADFGSMSDGAYAMAVQSDGKIVVAGETTRIGSSFDFALARYTSTGVLDETFGAGGRVVVDFSGGFDQAKALSLLPGGGIVVAGSASVAGISRFALAKFTADGALDETFGAGGKVMTGFAPGAAAAETIAVLGNGSIIAAGSAVDFSTDDHDFAAVQYTDSGAIDTAFGDAGWAKIDMGGDAESARAILVQSDGRIILAGDNLNASTGQSDFAMTRLSATGALDVAFGNAGQVHTDFNADTDQATSAVQQSDGKIVLAGLSSLDGIYRFAMARYTSDGALDDGFGSTGKATFHWGAGGDVANAVALDAQGRLVAAGFTCDTDGNSDVAVARIMAAENVPPPVPVPSQFELKDDPSLPGRKMLIFNGSAQNDRVEFRSMRRGMIEARVNGKKITDKFSNISRIVAYGNDGDDQIIARCAKVPVEFFGGKGNDRLVGSQFNDILVGGEGNDLLFGCHGNDLIVGGMGSDVLHSRLGDDLMVAGALTSETDSTFLRAVLSEWTQKKAPFGHRVSSLLGEVMDDNVCDVLIGTPGRDGFIVGAEDKVVVRKWWW